MWQFKKYDRGAIIVLAMVLSAIVLVSLLESVWSDHQPFIRGRASADLYSEAPVRTAETIAHLGIFRPEDSYAQWILAALAFPTTFISWLAVRGVRSTLRETRNVGRDQSRAYVHIELAELRWGNSAGGYPSIVLYARNDGATPAKWFECRAAVFTRPLNVDGSVARKMRFEDIELNEKKSARWSALGSKSELSFPVAFENIDIIRDAFSRADLTVEIAGSIRYATFFDEEFETQF